MSALAGRIARLKLRISLSEAKAGRKADSVAILYATKHSSADEIASLSLLEKNLVIGENRVQDAQGKFGSLSRLLPKFSFQKIEKHMIGNLQSNKARQAVGLFGCIQSVGTVSLAETISRCAVEEGKTMRIYIEANNGEEGKGGAPFESLDSLILLVGALPNLHLEGLMGMGVQGNADATREFFRRLRAKASEHNLKTSMGMSDDLEIAIEEGSDMVRVGRAIFSDL